MMNFITITDAALVMIIGGFNAFNWFIAMSGWSTVEMWATNYRVRINMSFIMIIGWSG